MEQIDAPFQALPVVDPDSRPFWEGCRRHTLLIQRCADCGQLRFPPAPLCWRCRSWEYTWEEQAGRGTVYTWVSVHHPIPPSMAPLVPYVVALIDLEAGVRMPTRLIEVAPDVMYAGMPVEVRFEEVSDEITLPLFAPSESGDAGGAAIQARA